LATERHRQARSSPIGLGPGDHAVPRDVIASVIGSRHDRLLRAVIDGAPDALVVLDGSMGRIVDCNPAAARLTGRDREALIGRGFADLGPAWQTTGERAPQAARDRLDEAVRDGVVEFDWQLERPDGGSVHCAARFVHVFDPAEAFVVAYLWPAEAFEEPSPTPARVTEQPARSTPRDAMIDAVIEHTPVAWALVDRGGRFELVNSAFARLTGLTVDDHRGAHIDDVLAAASPTPHASLLEDAVIGRHLKNVAISVVTPGAPEAAHELLESWHPVRTGDGDIVGAAVFVVEITEQRRAEVALRELNEDLEQQHARLASLHGIAGRLAATTGVPELAQVMADGVHELGASAGMVYLADGADLVLVASRGIGDAGADRWQRVRIDDPGPPGDAYRSGEPVYVADLAELFARYPGVAPAASRAGVSAIAEIPLTAGAVRGVAHIGFPEPQRFGATERNILESLANHLAQALDRAMLHDALASERVRLETALGAMPVGVILAEAPGGRVMYENVAAGLIWGNRVASAHGRPDRGVRLSDGRPYAPDEWPLARALRGQTVRGEEIAFRRTDGSRRVIEVAARPIERGTEVVAAVCTFEDVTDRVRDRRRLEQLQATTAALSSAVRAEDVFGVFLDRGVGAMGAVAGAIGVLPRDPADPVVLRQRGYPERPAEGAWSGADAAHPLAALLAHGPARWLPDADAVVPRVPRLADRHGQGSYQALAVVPLEVDGRRLGGIALGFDAAHEFGPDERELLTTAANLFAQALDRARLYDEQQRNADRQQFLARASMLFARAFDPDEILGELARLAVPRLADWCSVSIPEHGEIATVAVAHSDPARVARAREYLERYPSRLDGSTGAGAVLATGQSQFVARVTDDMIESIPSPDQRRRLRELGLISVISVPLVARGPVLGTLTLVNSESGRHFDADDLAFAEDLGNRAGRVLENSRLYARERHLAETLQSSLLPSTLPSIPALEIAARYIPADEGSEVGGDVYDAFAIGEDRGFAFVVGDVCGKGPEAAALTALARYTVRAEAERLAPGTILGGLNEAILRQHAGTRFLTMVYLWVRPHADGIDYVMANGGHPPAIVVRTDGRVEEVKPEGTILGVFPDSGYEQVVLEVNDGDVVILYTDGVTEARAPSGEFFGVERLLAVLASQAGRSTQDIVVAIESALDEFRGHRRFTDDIALMVLGAHADSHRADADLPQAVAQTTT